MLTKPPESLLLSQAASGVQSNENRAHFYVLVRVEHESHAGPPHLRQLELLPEPPRLLLRQPGAVLQRQVAAARHQPHAAQLPQLRPLRDAQVHLRGPLRRPGPRLRAADPLQQPLPRAHTVSTQSAHSQRKWDLTLTQSAHSQHTVNTQSAHSQHKWVRALTHSAHSQHECSYAYTVSTQSAQHIVSTQSAQVFLVSTWSAHRQHNRSYAYAVSTQSAHSTLKHQSTPLSINVPP
eukprot:4615731-Pyramimonas_sp.AAC.1